MEPPTTPEHMLLQVLQAACSQDTGIIKQAELKLAEWETEPGFYNALVDVFFNVGLDVSIRWMATVYFKNCVYKYWRVNAKNEIRHDEKVEIRRKLISGFNEPISQVAVQIAALIGKMARYDWPREWPELIPTLMGAVRTSESLSQHRALLILQQVVKTLSSKRMMADKICFEELTTNMYCTILNFWDTFTNSFFQSIQTNDSIENAYLYLEKAVLTLRILRKLTIFGFRKPHNSTDCMLFVETIFRRMKQSLELRHELRMRNRNENFLQLLDKFILKQAKLLNEFLEQHPMSFVRFVGFALEFTFDYAFYQGTNMIYEDDRITFPEFCIHCINLMKNIVSSAAYSSSVGQESSSIDATVLDAIKAKTEFFTRERLNYICDKVITRYFVFTQTELDLWMEDPEIYMSDEGGESWKYALRPCAETFFLTLINKFRTDMIAEVVKYINRAQENTLTNESSINDILLKDAIYNAAGISAFNLFDEIDFDKWFTSQLIQEIGNKTDKFRIIRRRGIWLIGKWSGVRLLRNLRPKVYELCLELLQQNEDIVVRLEASKTLKAVLDDFEFEPQPFVPYLEPCFGSLFTLLQEVKECDTKMNVLHTMSFLIDKVSDNIPMQAENLISYLPMLWKESSDHNMLRCAIMSTVHQIIRAMGVIPVNLTPFLFPVIAVSTNIKESCHVYLIEEGLELWLAVIENSTSLTPQLLDLCANLMPIIEASSENLRTVLAIVEAYVVLSPDVYLLRFGKNLITTCCYLMADMRPEGIVAILKLFDTCLRAEINVTLELLKPVLPNLFKEIYEDKYYPMVMTMYLTIIARVLLMNQPAFIEALQGVGLSDAMEKILDVWLKTMPLVSQLEKRKLLSLALASIMTVDNEIIQSRLPCILQNIVECIGNVMREDVDGELNDALVIDDEDDLDLIDDVDYKTHHSKRCRKLCMQDPVYRVALVAYVQSQVKALREMYGDDRYKVLLLTSDVGILNRLSSYVDLYVEIPQDSQYDE